MSTDSTKYDQYTENWKNWSSTRVPFFKRFSEEGTIPPPFGESVNPLELNMADFEKFKEVILLSNSFGFYFGLDQPSGGNTTFVPYLKVSYINKEGIEESVFFNLEFTEKTFHSIKPGTETNMSLRNAIRAINRANNRYFDLDDLLRVNRSTSINQEKQVVSSFSFTAYLENAINERGQVIKGIKTEIRECEDCKIEAVRFWVGSLRLGEKQWIFNNIIQNIDITIPEEETNIQNHNNIREEWIKRLDNYLENLPDWPNLLIIFQFQTSRQTENSTTQTTNAITTNYYNYSCPCPPFCGVC